MQLKNNWLLYSIPISLFSCWSAANQITPADRNILQQQQREMLEQNRQQREALERSITPSVTTPSQPAVPSGVCFPINDIQLFGAEQLPERVRQQLVRPYRTHAGHNLRYAGDQGSGGTVSVNEVVTPD